MPRVAVAANQILLPLQAPMHRLDPSRLLRAQTMTPGDSRQRRLAECPFTAGAGKRERWAGRVGLRLCNSGRSLAGFDGACECSSVLRGRLQLRLALVAPAADDVVVGVVPPAAVPLELLAAALDRLRGKAQPVCAAMWPVSRGEAARALRGRAQGRGRAWKPAASTAARTWLSPAAPPMPASGAPVLAGCGWRGLVGRWKNWWLPRADAPNLRATCRLVIWLRTRGDGRAPPHGARHASRAVGRGGDAVATAHVYSPACAVGGGRSRCAGSRSVAAQS